MMDMKKLVCLLGLPLLWLVFSHNSLSASVEPTAWWKFDETKGDEVLECVSEKNSSLEGNFRYIEGISGSAVKFDGFTTRIVCDEADAPRLSGSFTIEAWMAPQAYPWGPL